VSGNDLPYVRRWHPFTDWQWVPVVHSECIKCGRDHPDLAHHVYEYVAAFLAERLRQAFEAHFAGCVWCAAGRGFGYCDEARALFRLLPDGDRILIG
jgi:hypothetical protein